MEFDRRFEAAFYTLLGRPSRHIGTTVSLVRGLRTSSAQSFDGPTEGARLGRRRDGTRLSARASPAFARSLRRRPPLPHSQRVASTLERTSKYSPA